MTAGLSVRTALAAAAIATLVSSSLYAQGTPSGGAPRTPPMVLTISAWADGTQIPAKHTQAGEQISPELKWTNVPAGTQSFVVNMLDPDVIVLGGGVSNVDRLYESVPRLWGAHVFSDSVRTRLAKARHGDSSGVRGAAWLWDV